MTTPTGPHHSLFRPPSELQPHPQAGLVPAMTRAEYAALRSDVERRGLQVPIEITQQGTVLDGHQRLRAALELDNQEVPIRTVEVADELAYMLHAALTRRQLNAGQKAALALGLDQCTQARVEAEHRRLANLRNQPEVATLPPRAGKTRELVARVAGVSARTVQDVSTVRDHDRDLFARVQAGELSAELAARRVRRRLRDRSLAPPPPLPDGRFGLLYADPPWQLGHPDGPSAPESHYPTLPTMEIAALAVPAAEDALLFLWAVSSLLPEALEVMTAWGFRCKTTLVWVKPSIGSGVWSRNRHELLLVGLRGSVAPPDQEDRADSVIEAPRGRHSEKPAVVYELIERMYPQLTKLELFARRTPRPGWAAWGNELH
jgi:N6-adenosine-specific RNA methylase IME4/ParB-like chromosome segregation protein Spo0J